MPIYVGQNEVTSVPIGTGELQCAFLGASTIFTSVTNSAPTSNALGATVGGSPTGSQVPNNSAVTFTSTVIDPDGLAGGTYTLKRDHTATAAGIVTSIPTDGTTVGGNAMTILDGGTNTNVSHTYQSFFTDSGGIIIASETLTIEWLLMFTLSGGASLDARFVYPSQTGAIVTLEVLSTSTAGTFSTSGLPVVNTDFETMTIRTTANGINVADHTTRLAGEVLGAQVFRVSGDDLIMTFAQERDAQNFMAIAGSEAGWFNSGTSFTYPGVFATSYTEVSNNQALAINIIV